MDYYTSALPGGSRKGKQLPIPTYTLAFILHPYFQLNKPLLLRKMKPTGSSRVGAMQGEDTGEKTQGGLTPLHVLIAWKKKN